MATSLTSKQQPAQPHESQLTSTASSKQHPKSPIQFSLLDITYPYYKSSMLSKSIFYGFQCLMFQSGIYFCLVYTISNFITKGYILKWDILQVITNNLLMDLQVITICLLLAIAQMYICQLMLNIVKHSLNKYRMVYGYCLVWMMVFVVGMGWVLGSFDFYFTDRIFIVVIGWSAPVKTASYCIDYLHMMEQKKKQSNDTGKVGTSNVHSLMVKFKFIISPKVIFRQFIVQHNPKLPIHFSYLLIKSIVACICLLINYIVMTEFIAPYLQPQIYNSMSFIQLFFKLIPLCFYVNICLYYLIMENIMLAMAQITQLNNRHYYLDWWNACTISQFLDKWVLLIGAFSKTYLGFLNKQWQHFWHLTIIFIMLFTVFGEQINFKIIIFAAINIGTVFFLGQAVWIQNNYIVHLLTISFTPFSLAAQLKYNIFS